MPKVQKIAKSGNTGHDIRIAIHGCANDAGRIRPTQISRYKRIYKLVRYSAQNNKLSKYKLKLVLLNKKHFLRRKDALALALLSVEGISPYKMKALE